MCRKRCQVQGSGSGCDDGCTLARCRWVGGDHDGPCARWFNGQLVCASRENAASARQLLACIHCPNHPPPDLSHSRPGPAMSLEQASGAHPNNGQTSDSAPTHPWPAATTQTTTTTTPLAPLKPATTASTAPANPSSTSPIGIPQIPTGFSASTEEILRRVSANASAHVGTPGYEAAREQVLKSMVTSDKMPTPPPMLSTKRGARGGSRAGLASSSTPRPESAAGAGESSATPASAASVTSARGRGNGRGRGRGGSRGGKRKRAADTPDSEVSLLSRCVMAESNRPTMHRTTRISLHPTPPCPPRRSQAAMSRSRRSSCPSSHLHRQPPERSAYIVAQPRPACARCANEAIAP